MYSKNAWKDYSKEEFTKVMDFAENYKKFITFGKTEREAVKICEAEAISKGFKNIKDYTSLKPGDKVYAINKKKNIALFVIGKNPIEKGLRILGAHIDSPRLDIKQNPLYEKDNLALMDTHYYGGVKFYQWVTIPLALYGVVCLKNGQTIDIKIGDDPNDPVVGITDLLPHLANTQMKKNASEFIDGESLDITVGSIPLVGEEKNAVKANILKILNEKYGIEEEDFLSSEIEVVPAGPARDYGLDRSLIAGYGHDDRVCAYASLEALIDAGACDFTTCVILVDKEEVSSIGATGAHSKWFENVVSELVALQDNYSSLKVRRAFESSYVISCDVSVAYDPMYAYVNDPKNSSYVGNGLCFLKFTGVRGKSGANDAMPEFLAKIRNVMDKESCHYQTAEIGKVDQGGGGTIAYILSNYNMYVVDAGVPVLSMHSPMELVSKADLYEAYKSYKAFLKNI